MKVISSGNTNGNDDGGSGILQLTWKADPLSWQDAYQVSYAEVITGSLSSSSSSPDSLIVSSVLSLGNNLSQSQNGSSRQLSTSVAAITATTSTDSNVLVIQATKESIEDPSTPIECTLESLLPGRNYSVSVKSLSSGVASNDTIVYHTMSKINKILLYFKNKLYIFKYF